MYRNKKNEQKMKMRAFWSQVIFRNFYLKVFSVFQKWTFINVQNRFPFWTFVFTLLLKKTTKIIGIKTTA